MNYYDKILDRVSHLIKTDDPQKELDHLMKFQMEIEPEMNKSQALNCVILGLVRTYQDYTLDFLWLEYIKQNNTEFDSQAA